MLSMLKPMNDILFLGPYNINSIKNRFLNFVDRKLEGKYSTKIENIDQRIF